MSCVPARALFHTAPRCVEIRDVPAPRPAAGEVLVRTVCSGISGGTERLVYRGEVPAELALDDTIDALGAEDLTTAIVRGLHFGGPISHGEPTGNELAAAEIVAWLAKRHELTPPA